MPDARSELVRERLRRLAERRAEHAITGEALAAETRGLVADAQTVGLPMTEVARLLRIDRTSLYRTYVNVRAA